MKQEMTIGTYIANFPKPVQEILQKIRALAHEYTPANSTEEMRYGVPTIQVNGKNVFHFAAFKKHVSIYPASDELIAKYPKLAEYRTGKGTLQFPLDKPIPYAQIEQMIKFRVV